MLLLAALLVRNVPVDHLAALRAVTDRSIRARMIAIGAEVSLHSDFTPGYQEFSNTVSRILFFSSCSMKGTIIDAIDSLPLTTIASSTGVVLR